MDTDLEAFKARVTQLSRSEGMSPWGRVIETYRVFRALHRRLEGFDAQLIVAADDRDRELAALGDLALESPDQLQVTGGFRFNRTVAQLASDKERLTEDIDVLRTKVTQRKSELKSQSMTLYEERKRISSCLEQVHSRWNALSDEGRTQGDGLAIKAEMDRYQDELDPLEIEIETFEKARREELLSLKETYKRHHLNLGDLDRRTYAVKRDLGRAVYQSTSETGDDSLKAVVHTALAEIQALRSGREDTLELLNNVDMAPVKHAAVVLGIGIIFVLTLLVML